MSNTNKHRKSKKGVSAWLLEEEKLRLEEAKKRLNIKTDRDLINTLVTNFLEDEHYVITQLK